MIKLMGMGLVLAGVGFMTAPGAKAASINAEDSSSYYYNLGKEDQDARKYSSAWHYYEKATTLNPGNTEAFEGIATVCLQMNRMAPAIKALEEVVKQRPADDKTQWKLAKIYFNYGQADKVIAMVPKLHQRLPDEQEWAYMLGKSYYTQQNYGKGVEYLKIAVKEDPKNPEAAYMLGRMLTLMSNYKEAIPFYKQSLAADSTSQPYRYYEFALVLATSGDYNQSLEWFQKALEKGYKARDDFYMNMAYTFADAHKSDKAIAMMREILAHRPQDLGLIDGLANICYHSGRYKDAIGYWDKLLAYDDKNARALYQIGLAYLKMGNDQDGQQLCDRAIAMDPALGVLKHAKQMQQ